MMMYYGGYYWWIILIAIILIALYFLGINRPQAKHTESPMDVLKMRYARGEISEDEFERMKKTLSGSQT